MGQEKREVVCRSDDAAAGSGVAGKTQQQGGGVGMFGANGGADGVRVAARCADDVAPAVNMGADGSSVKFGVELYAPGVGADAVGLMRVVFVGGEAGCRFRQAQHGLEMGNVGGEVCGQGGEDGIVVAGGQAGDGRAADFEPARVVADFAAAGIRPRKDEDGADYAEHEEDWQLLPFAARKAHLARLRRTDPDAARALLADGAWLKARAPEREQILDALVIGLGPADEQILEERLDDRAEAVRGRAAELLSRLPSSALIARAEALAERHVVVTRRALRAPAVELHGIEMTDALARDRYPAKAHRTSASLARLEEVIARIPTWRWPDLVGISAAELARARVRCDGQKVELLVPLVRAAVAWRDGELAAALADLGPSPAPAGLFGLLDEPRREALLHRLITAKRYSAVVTCTLSWPSELTAEQSRIFARSLIAVTRPGSYISDSRWWGVLPARCAPDALDEVLAILRGAPPDTLSDLRAQTVITALELRRELLELTDRTDQEAS